MALEELELDYQLKLVDLGKGEQHSKEFLAMNPNGRIPVIRDTDTGVCVFESGAILIYLAEKAGRLLPKDLAGRYNVIQWVMFQMAGIGPMQGQAVSFIRYFPEVVQAAIDRYVNETRRLYEVMNVQLAKNDYLAGDYSIADIANYSWVRSHKWARVPVDELEHLQRWMASMQAKPGVRRGCEVPPSPGKASLVKSGGQKIVTR